MYTSSFSFYVSLIYQRRQRRILQISSRTRQKRDHSRLFLTSILFRLTRTKPDQIDLADPAKISSKTFAFPVHPFLLSYLSFFRRHIWYPYSYVLLHFHSFLSELETGTPSLEGDQIQSPSGLSGERTLYGVAETVRIVDSCFFWNPNEWNEWIILQRATGLLVDCEGKIAPEKLSAGHNI